MALARGSSSWTTKATWDFCRAGQISLEQKVNEGMKRQRKRTTAQKDYRVWGLQEEDKKMDWLFTFSKKKIHTLSYLNLTELFHQKHMCEYNPDKIRLGIGSLAFSCAANVCNSSNSAGVSEISLGSSLPWHSLHLNIRNKQSLRDSLGNCIESRECRGWKTSP